MDRDSFDQNVLIVRLTLAELVGDNLSALDLARERERTNDVEGAREDEQLACALVHDVACFRAVSTALEPTTDAALRAAPSAFVPETNAGIAETRMSNLQQANVALERWSDVLKAAPAFHQARIHSVPILHATTLLSDAPLAALALAKLGDPIRAHLLADTMPNDCLICLRVHGRIDESERNWNGAAWWFAQAAAAAPSLPSPDSDWGEMLLHKGDYDAAIAKFKEANQKGPHFADPLEMWGEALMQENRSDLALSKFEEANKCAPNWGRLHLKWGEALFFAGKRDEATKQFATAATLDLTPEDRVALGRFGI
jgi:tetratricopeptide (TPR) repeat protein